MKNANLLKAERAALNAAMSFFRHGTAAGRGTWQSSPRIAGRFYGACYRLQVLKDKRADANVKPRCGLDDPNWFTEKMQEFDKHEESRDYGPEL